MTKNILIRADASYDIGTGHVRRCITLAKYLRKCGMNITFACRDDPGNLIEEIRSERFPVKILRLKSDVADQFKKTDYNIFIQKQDAYVLSSQISQKYDLVILDSYFLNVTWENLIKAKTKHIFVLDDLANREHNCEVLLDQFLGRKPEDYRHLLLNDCLLLFGPEYFLIREEIQRLKNIKKNISEETINILITLGGHAYSDLPAKLISQILKDNTLSNLHFYLHAQYSHLFLDKTKINNVTFFRAEQFNNVLLEVDHAITAAGMTLYEIAYLGIPAFILPLNELQKKVADEISKHTVAVSIPNWKNLNTEKIAEKFVIFLKSTPRKDGCEKKVNFIDGLGVERVTSNILQLIN